MLRGRDWRDVSELLQRVPGEWSLEAENMAMFLDRFDFFLNSEYASWTADPKDEKQRAADAERRRRDGHKTPSTPLLFPVALRPDDVLKVRFEQYEKRVAEFKPPERLGAGGGKLENVKPRDLASLLGF